MTDSTIPFDKIKELFVAKVNSLVESDNFLTSSILFDLLDDISRLKDKIEEDTLESTEDYGAQREHARDMAR